jgi:hypothetical protein
MRILFEINVKVKQTLRQKGRLLEVLPSEYKSVKYGTIESCYSIPTEKNYI